MVAQIVAIAIFICMFVIIIIGKTERHIVTLFAGGLMLILVQGIIEHDLSDIWRILSIEDLFRGSFWIALSGSADESVGINWATILFIAGMMIMVEGMGKSGFFRWICLTIAKAVHYNARAILVTFMILSAVLAMFIDSITVILFLATVTIELSRLIKFDPVPVLLSEIFCSNLGGSATMCGDPPNIIVGTSLGYSFFDFLSNTGLVALAGLVVMVVYYYMIFKNKLPAGNRSQDEIGESDPASAITDATAFRTSCIIFLLAIILLVSHSATHLTVATIGCFIGVLTLITQKDRTSMIKGIDYHTLLFFVGLFVVIGGLEGTGVLDLIANWIAGLGAGSDYICVISIMVISAVASAFIDNIPFAAVMIPIIKTISASRGIPLDTLAWSLSIGTDIGGSATPIGASANVVGISVAGKNGHFITWGKYLKSAVPATVIVLLVAAIILKLRYFA